MGNENTADRTFKMAARQYPFIEKMTVRSHKESWLAGKSDIYMKTYTAWNNKTSKNPITLVNNQTSWMNNADGNLDINKFKRKEVKNSTEKLLNKSYTTGWEPSTTQGNQLFYAMYEKDSWPCSYKNQDVANNEGFVMHIPFRSYDDPYCYGVITYYAGPCYMGSYKIDIQGQMKFNSKI